MSNQDEEHVFESVFEEREYNLMHWVSFWRANPHRFVEDYLGMRLYLFQKILFYMMNTTRFFTYIAARSQGKSFLIALYCVTRCILYPGTNIVLASSTKEQASLIITDKIWSMYRKYESVRDEIGGTGNIKRSTEDASVEFLNGSKIRVTVAGKTGRGKRANVLVVDEFVFIDDYSVMKDVLRPMAGATRVPRFVEKNPDKYSDYEEPNVEILISSAGYKSKWGWNEFKSFAGTMLKDITKGFAVSIPFEMSLVHNIVPESDMEMHRQASLGDPYAFAMEYEALFVGENENGFFSLDSIVSNRTLKKAFIPPTDIEFIENSLLSKPKKPLTNMPLQAGEMRLVSLDVALMGNKDTSAFTCMRMIPLPNGEYERHVVYLETINHAEQVDRLAIRLKQLFYDFQATYAVLDANGNGIAVYEACAKIQYDEARDVEYPAWSSINDKEMRQKYDTSAASPVLYTVKATDSYNTEAAIQLRMALSSGKMKLLIDDNKKRETMNAKEKVEFQKMNAHQQVEKLAPFRQITALQNELIALESTQKSSGNIKIVTKGMNTKDRYSSLAYVNHRANELELDLMRKSNKSTMTDYIYDVSWKKEALGRGRRR